MAPIPRLVPWTSWHEWDAVRVLLASPRLSEAQLGVKKVTMEFIRADEEIKAFTGMVALGLALCIKLEVPRIFLSYVLLVTCSLLLCRTL